MVRYETDQDDGYKTVSSRIRRMSEKAGELDSEWAESRLQNIKPDEPFTVNFGIPGVYESECFVGRDHELAEIEKCLKYSKDRRTGVIYGMGGMGKTQLALNYANLHREDYSAVFWFNSKNEDTLKQSFLSNAIRIKDSPLFKNRWTCVEEKGPDEAVTALGEWLSMARNKRWLLCFDNYDEINIYDIRKYFPVAKQGAILVTTRSHGIFWGHGIPVEKFAQVSDCLLVLSHTSGRDNLEQSKLIEPITLPSLLTRLDADARKLAERLDGLPLALTTAGCYLRLSPASFADYLHRYQESWSRLLEMSPRLSSYDQTLRTTWDLSLSQVRKQNQLAEKILQLWAYFDNQDIWFQLLQKGQSEGPGWLLQVTKDEMQFEWTMQALCDHGLVTKNPVSPSQDPEIGGYSMHSCVHDWTIHVLDDPLNGKKWHPETLKLALFCLRQHLPTKGYAKYWTPHPRLLKHTSRCQRILDDIEVCTENDDIKSLMSCMHFLGNLYRDQGKLDRAEMMFRQALRKMEMPKIDVRLKAMLLHNLGAVIHQQGRNVEAEKLLKEALDLKRETFGPNHISTLRSVSTLALLYKAQWNFSEAEKLYSGPLKDAWGEFGDSDISKLQNTFHVAYLHYERCELVEAEQMFLEVLNGYKKAFDDDHPLILGVYTALARLHLKQQKPVETEEMFKLALQGYTSHFDEHHESTLQICVELGHFYSKQARLPEAEQRFKQAEEGYVKNIGLGSQLRKSSLTVLASVAGLASLYNYQAKFPEAEHYYLQALVGYKDALGENHKSTLDAARDLGRVYWRQKNWVAAEKQYNWVLEGYQRTSGPEGLLALSAAVSLGQIYHAQGKLDEAEKMFKQAEKGYGRDLGPNSEPRTIALCSLVEIHRTRGKMVEAGETENQTTQRIYGWNEEKVPRPQLSLTWKENEN
ncbi:uncharacterized protein N7443_009239 [Penicillium atrosanguineum]|nr:uncharacterized protein N7443_009239 [Penicillium atrosanguineum]KAJ5293286.1 hypothetical protein N7443_009239 [Penicillium atrosanguineum]